MAVSTDLLTATGVALFTVTALIVLEVIDFCEDEDDDEGDEYDHIG